VNGQVSDQTVDPAVVAAGGEGDLNGEDGDDGGEVVDPLTTLGARLDLMEHGITELRNAIVQSRNQQPAPTHNAQVEVDDDEPITGSKVKKIVEGAINQAVNSSTAAGQQQVWDDKAKREFPFADPKFQLEFKKQWDDQVGSGLNPGHPKALYNVAKITARVMGKPGKAAPRQSSPDTTHSGEAPSGTSAAPTRRASTASKISDDDPRLRFYLMKGKKSKEQIQSMKEKLAASDARKAAR